ncbi:hypothetical protein [Citrobacter sp. Cu233]|uniref:hypothetical protein n=1 Tax=Citrobacter sp. Cu233 TaxID=2985160 RepID=UPI002576E536|nr:hypothetical protein [Citrobacter sp. Cu233]MDM2933610.1 hypothetical protein [Citrobacter sp. Cu233]
MKSTRQFSICFFPASDIAKAGIEELQSQNEELAIQLANAESKRRELAAENGQVLHLLTDISENHNEYINQDEYLYAGEKFVCNDGSVSKSKKVCQK